MHPTSRARAILAALLLLSTLPARAHVKWFAPYIVDDSPAPISRTLADP
jgi:hypothetical protein